MTIDVVEYRGWPQNLRLVNDTVELLITLEVGPRIISYRLLDGENVFWERLEELGKTGEVEWQVRGGHRLWAAPETRERTYYPDNGPVKWQSPQNTEGDQVTVWAGRDREIATGLLTAIQVNLPRSGSAVQVTQTIQNIGKFPTEVACWGLSVLRPGGVAILPLPEKRPHPGSPKNAHNDTDFWPNYHLVCWPFLDFRDPRLLLGSRFIALKQDPAIAAPAKFGLLHTTDWAAYLNRGTLLVKKVPYQEGQRYPDHDCNLETFTNADMLELEVLGPLVQLQPTETTTLVERWQLFKDVPESSTEEEFARNVTPLAQG